MRAHGLLVRPRFAEGRTDVVTGYSVARRPESGERPIWYGGGHLARDLTLPRLRESWPDTPEEASAAAAEWTAAKRGRRVVAPGRERTVLDEAAQRKTDASISELVEQLRSVPLDDRHMWEVVARQTAGALAAWSNATEATPGPLAAAAEAVSRSAQTYRSHPKPWTGAARPLGSAALLLASASRGGIGVVAEVALARQMLRLVQALHDAARAAEQLRQAQHLAAVTRSQLVAVRDGLASRAAAGVPVPAVAAPAAQLDPEAQAVLDRLRASQADGPRPRSPIPASLDERRRQTAQVRPDRGVER